MSKKRPGFLEDPLRGLRDLPNSIANTLSLPGATDPGKIGGEIGQTGESFKNIMSGGNVGGTTGHVTEEIAGQFGGKGKPGDEEAAGPAGYLPQMPTGVNTPAVKYVNPAEMVMGGTQVGVGAGSQAAGSRQSMADILAALQAQMAGTAPSISEQQLKQGTEANIKAALAQAATARGGGVGAARQAIRSGSEATQQAVGQSAIARIQEQRSAQELGSKVATAMHEQDINVALGQAKLDFDTKKANLDAKVTSAVKNGELSVEEGRNMLQKYGMDIDKSYKDRLARVEEFKSLLEAQKVRSAERIEKNKMTAGYIGAGASAMASMFGSGGKGMDFLKFLFPNQGGGKSGG